MKILSIRKGFQADHSSTSYEFLAIDKPLSYEEQRDVASLSSRARPTRRRVSFIYHGDCNDLPGGWWSLMEKYYDVMYSESYDWWNLSMAYETDRKKMREIKKYEFSGVDDMGVTVSSKANRVIVSIHCRLSPEFDFFSKPYKYDDEEDDEFEETIESGNCLLNLLAKNREYLKKGHYRLLYGVWQKYGIEPEKSKKSESRPPPETSATGKLPHPVNHLLALLRTLDD